MTPIRRLALLFLFVVCMSLPALKAQQTTEKFVQETKYLLSLPKGYNSDTTTRWPLMIFLHGSGEAGVDIEKVKAHGPPKLIGKGKEFPMIVVSPNLMFHRYGTMKCCTGCCRILKSATG